MDYADDYILQVLIASSLDYPSVYMGGPSRGSMDRARRVMDILYARYEIRPTEAAEKDAAMVRTWMNPDGTRIQKKGEGV
jgi:hypothetical protein